MKTFFFILSISALYFTGTSYAHQAPKAPVYDNARGTMASAEISKDSAQKLLESVIYTDPWDSNARAHIIIAIKAGAYVGTTYGSVFRTVLHGAAEYGDFEIAELLLKYGANIEGRDFDGITPIHMAVYVDNKKMVAFLLKHGAKVNAQDNLGRTPLDMTNDKEIKNLLKSKGGKTGEALKK